ncbi:M48 family metalloprotease [Tardisphaera miroshnichenkoae]
MIIHYRFQGHEFPLVFQNPYLARIIWHMMIDEHLLILSLFLSAVAIPLSYLVNSSDKRVGEKAIFLGMMLSAIPLFLSPLTPVLFGGRIILLSRVALSHSLRFDKMILGHVSYSIIHWTRWDPEAWLLGAALVMLVVHAVASSSKARRQRLKAPNWVQTEVQKLSAMLGIKAPEVVLIDSGEPNAFAPFSLFGSKIVVSVGLLETLSRDELRAVLAHEISHVSHRDPLKRLLSRSLRIVMLANPLPHFMEPWLSRSEEYAADREAALLTSPSSMISALLKLSGVLETSEEMPLPLAPIPAFLERPFVLRVFSGHPSTADRIRNLLEMVDGRRRDRTPNGRRQELR